MSTCCCRGPTPGLPSVSGLRLIPAPDPSRERGVAGTAHAVGGNAGTLRRRRAHRNRYRVAPSTDRIRLSRCQLRLHRSHTAHRRTRRSRRSRPPIPAARAPKSALRPRRHGSSRISSRKRSSATTGDSDIGRTLYKLLVPIELEGFLASADQTQLVLDAHTAGIPWEMLDDEAPGIDHHRWSIRSKLLRKFKTERFRERATDATSRAAVLVIGEPDCPPEYPPLPGAYAEAKAVAELVTAAKGEVVESVRAVMAGEQDATRPNARTVWALLNGEWRIVHVAGHGHGDDTLAILAAWSCRTTRFSGRAKSVRCGSCRNSCSSIAATLERSRAMPCSRIARTSHPAWRDG